MKNFINIVLVGFILTILLFLTLVYPGMEMFARIQQVFKYLLIFIIFVAFIAFLIYLLVEIKSINSQIAENNQNSTSLKEDIQSFPVKFDKTIDAQENYNQLTRHLLTLMQLALSANSTFLYLYNKVERKYILQDCVTSDNVTLAEEFKIGGSIYSDITKRETPKIYDRSQFDSTYLVYYKNSQEINSLMLAPIIVNEFVGIIGIDSQEKDIWHYDDTKFFQHVLSVYLAGRCSSTPGRSNKFS